MRVSRLVIHADAPGPAVRNDFLDPLDRPIEEVHPLAGGREPAAADDQRSPAADLRDRRGARIVDQTLYGLEQSPDVEPGALTEVEADIGVGSRMSRAARSRPAEHNGSDAGNSPQNRRNAFQKRVGRFHPANPRTLL
jgi:hypothetical protein